MRKTVTYILDNKDILEAIHEYLKRKLDDPKLIGNLELFANKNNNGTEFSATFRVENNI